MPSVAIRRFGGMKADLNPHAVPPGFSLVQVNVDVVRPGEFRVRGGTRLVTFSDPPKPSAPSWSRSVSNTISFTEQTASVPVITGFSRSAGETLQLSTEASCEVDKAEWTASLTETLTLTPVISAETQPGTSPDVEVAVSDTLTLSAAITQSSSLQVSAAVATSVSFVASATASKSSPLFQSFTLMGMV